MGKRTRHQDDDDTSEEIPRASTAEAPADTGEDPPDEPADDLGVERDDQGEGEGRRTRVLRFARRLMDRRELSAETREILGSVLATSDKAKTEAVRLVAREVRAYLDALELKKDLKELLTGYSLEISLSLKPLDGRVAATEPAAESAAAPGPGEAE